MKSYTDLEQSKKLVEILPLESADMFWLVSGNTPRVHVLTEPLSNYSKWESYPCWSLSALLDVLPYPTLHQQGDGAWGLDVWVEQVNPYSVNNTICGVDACVEMIEWLVTNKYLKI